MLKNWRFFFLNWIDPIWSCDPMWSYVILCDPMILWSYDPVILWSYDPMILWSCDPAPDHMILWSGDPMILSLILWSYDPMILWSWLVIRWSCDPAILTVRKEERRLRKEGGTLANFYLDWFWDLGGSWEPFGLRRALQVLVVRWWSFDQAAKINEKSMNHLVKKLRKISEKSTKNQPKIDQKSTKNRWKSRSGGGLGGFSL